MADTTYPNLSGTSAGPFVGPEVNSSDGTWGNKLNNDLLIIDNQFAPSGTGTVVRRNALGNGEAVGFDITNAPLNAKLVRFLTSGSLRWEVGAGSTPESGGNAGSDFAIARAADSGVILDICVSIARSTGIMNFLFNPTVGGSPILTQANSGALASVIGAIQMFAGSGDPPNWMICNGRSLSTSTFAALFGVIGYAYGGSGSNFNIPNMAERVPIGQSPNPPSLVPFNTNTVGTVFGVGTYFLTVGDLPSHQHTVPNPPHTHAFTWQKVSDVQTTSTGGIRVTDINATGDSQTATTQPDTTGTLTSNLTGGGGGHNNVQPSIVLNFIIRVL